MTCTCKMLPGGYLIHSCGLEGKWEKENFGRLFLGETTMAAKRATVVNSAKADEINDYFSYYLRILASNGEPVVWFGNLVRNLEIRGKTLCQKCIRAFPIPSNGCNSVVMEGIIWISSCGRPNDKDYIKSYLRK